jgi:hypothetical protein
MQRRFRQTVSFEERLAGFARSVRERAKALPQGKERDELMRKARQVDTASQLNDLMKTPEPSE